MASPFSGVGISSVANIEAAAKGSGLYPSPLQMTNGYDPPPAGGGYHLTGNACDFSNGGDSGTPEMDQFASWVASNYGPNSLEIIHVNQDGSTVEWKMGKQMPTGWYGAATLAMHKNHVHWAITNPGLSAAPGTPNGAVSATLTSASSSNPITGFVASALGSILAPVFEFALTAGMVAGGGVLMLLGAYVVGRRAA